MTFRGYIRNGVVVLDAPLGLPDGTPVRVEASEGRESSRHVKRPAPGAQRRKKQGRSTSKSARGASLFDRLRNVVGKAKDLPPDASSNIDHYLYGAPKRR